MCGRFEVSAQQWRPLETVLRRGLPGQRLACHHTHWDLRPHSCVPALGELGAAVIFRDGVELLTCGGGVAGGAWGGRDRCAGVGVGPFLRHLWVKEGGWASANAGRARSLEKSQVARGGIGDSFFFF